MLGRQLGSERYEMLDLGNSKSGGLETRGRIKRRGAIFAVRGFHFVDASIFKRLDVVEIAHPTTVARVTGRSAFSGMV